jgi:hypothetical protein
MIMPTAPRAVPATTTANEKTAQIGEETLTLPNLSFSGGGSTADGMSSSGGNSLEAGNFYFKSEDGWASALKSYAPVIVAGVALYFVFKK